MLLRTCDVEFLAPDEDPPPPAPVCEDMSLHAKLATAARSQRGRRFAFCEVTDSGEEIRTRVAFQGIQANDGTCVLLDVGRPVGWYTSVDSAFAHRGREGMSVVWTEPVNPPNHSAANLEAAQGDPSIWCVLLPFQAHGPHDARIRAIEIATAFEETTPGLTREMALISDAQAGIAPMTLFCPVPGCLREPYHHGDHAPAISEQENGAADGDPTSDAAEEPSTNNTTNSNEGDQAQSNGEGEGGCDE
ncbi:MAG TPA: hypothetical protein VE172_19910 [Stackebrandtia sp.]|jgi:hypothetical protein|uniref:hypothetical protein n=1 Tax=Stackebrandtia sp. TaxID=2023065 RepID=UPI002D2DAEF5|nr:hypothetical protein [Stackebrandtia sp.]HZE41071.1 hypothetical protein [Stackebrandtia sp.]